MILVGCLMVILGAALGIYDEFRKPRNQFGISPVVIEMVGAILIGIDMFLI